MIGNKCLRKINSFTLQLIKKVLDNKRFDKNNTFIVLCGFGTTIESFL